MGCTPEQPKAVQRRIQVERFEREGSVIEVGESQCERSFVGRTRDRDLNLGEIW